jgi:hypothetical protein
MQGHNGMSVPAPLSTGRRRERPNTQGLLPRLRLRVHGK